MLFSELDRKLVIMSVITDLFAIFVVTFIHYEGREKEISIFGSNADNRGAVAVFL